MYGIDPSSLMSDLLLIGLSNTPLSDELLGGYVQRMKGQFRLPYTLIIRLGMKESNFLQVNFLHCKKKNDIKEKL